MILIHALLHLFILAASTNRRKSTTRLEMSKKVRLIWHRGHDLRLHDNELYTDLCCDGDNQKERIDSTNSNSNISTVSLYVFDPQHFQWKKSMVRESGYKTIWCGPFAGQNLIDAVTGLRQGLRSIGGELIVRSGDPATIVPKVVKEIGATEIYYSEEPGTYETEVAQNILSHYIFLDHDSDQREVKVVSKSLYTLYHPNDLPFHPNEWDQLAHPKNKHKKKKSKNVHQNSKKNPQASMSNFDLVDVSTDRFKGICRIMGDFRKAARAATAVRKPLHAPLCLIQPTSITAVNIGIIPTLEELFMPLLSSEENNTILGLDREVCYFIIKCAIEKGNESNRVKVNETEALKRMKYFITEGHAATADRSKADVSDDNSSRFSVHFTLGTLSPRAAYWKAYEVGDGCKWLMSHLEMRDFFLFTAYASGNKLFMKDGIPLGKRKKDVNWKNPKNVCNSWKRWLTGNTSLPLVDAGMKELMSTGYCSNKVRQNIASVLTKDSQIDWRAGAEWFQFLLEDHCVGANFGNWLYFSGLGPDPKNRHFRTVSQALRYDADGLYVRKWLSTLSEIESREALLRPWAHQVPGYQNPIVDPETQLTWEDKQRVEDTGKLVDD